MSRACNISISPGNRKVGNIPSFNLPPIETCLNSKTCATFVDDLGNQRRCYAVQPYTMYPQTKKAWDRNFQLCKKDLFAVERKLSAYFRASNILLFRIHTSGDFYSKEYLDMWIRIAKKFPNVKFLAYTKVYGFFNKLQLPRNFTVFLSYMPSISLEAATRFSNMIGLPMAVATTKRPKGFITCPEQTTKQITCSECKICWNVNNLKRRMNIHFIPHR